MVSHKVQCLGQLCLLYTYVNELPNLVQSNIKMFADDVKQYRTVCGRQDAQQLQKDIEALEHWSNIWLLRLNPLKCKVMHCGQRSQRCDYYLEDEHNSARKIQETNLERDLGVFISNTLKASSHCQTPLGGFPTR